MDTSKWRPAQHTSGAFRDLTMESGDWRAQLQRQRIVNKLMDTLKKHLPFSGYERLHELKKIAERVEEEIYTTATSQSDYSRKICLNMLTMETRLQNPMTDSLQSNSSTLYYSPNFSVPLDSTAQTRNPNGGDWQEEVYQKIKAMKELYQLDLKRQVNNQGQQPPIRVSYLRQQMMSQSMHINIGSTGMQVSSSGLQQSTIAAVASQNLNLQNVQNISSVSQQQPLQQQRLIDQQNMFSSVQQPSLSSASGAVGDPTMESGGWKAQLPPGSRERIQNKIMDTLKRHLPYAEDEGLRELKKIAVRFEEKIYAAATSQSDYLRKISLKILTMETRSQDPMSNLFQSSSAASSVFYASNPGVSL